MLFFGLFACNVALLLALIRWRRLQSIEGMGMAFVLLAVASDGLSLFLSVIVPGADADYARQRMTAEISPTLIHILGLSLFGLGLALIDPRPRRIRRVLKPEERADVSAMGAALAIGGLLMKFLALYLWGLRS